MQVSGSACEESCMERDGRAGEFPKATSVVPQGESATGRVVTSSVEHDWTFE